NLGWCYVTDFGIETNMNDAVAWYEISAEQNDPVAQNNLVHWYRNSAEPRNPARVML
ncbi:hypothetical protein BJ742DRAFT_678422, partial [Cladochytrium replicatum]